MKKLGDTSFDLSTLISEAESSYNFQPVLTSKLDNHTGGFDEKIILEIVLWKTNRYPHISDSLIEYINQLRADYKDEKAIDVLRFLLRKEAKGYDLPMASTILRFACPEHLQIIDQRVYRFITPDVRELKIPSNIQGKILLYFSYITRLREACTAYNIPFSKSDRIFYQMDKMLNKDIPIRY